MTKYTTVRLLPLLFTSLLWNCSGPDTPVDATPTGEPTIADITNPVTDGDGFNDPSTGDVTNPTDPSTPLVDESSFSGRYVTEQVELTWLATTLDNLSAYSIRRSTVPISDARFGQEVYRGRNTTFNDTSPPIANQVYYRIFYEFTGGIVAPGDEIAITTLTEISDLVPEPVANAQIINSGNGFTLTWVNPADNDLREIQIFKIQDDNENAVVLTNLPATPRWTISAADAAALVDIDVITNQRYHYALKAVDALTNESTVVTLTALFADITAPEPVTRLESIVSESAVQFNWLASVSDDVESYLVVRHVSQFPAAADATPSNSYTVTETTLTDGSLANQDYFYSIFAVDGNSNTSAATSVQITPTVVIRPPTPSNFQSNYAVNEEQVGLSWNDASASSDSLLLVVSSDSHVNTLQDLTGTEQFPISPNTATTFVYDAVDKTERFFSLFAITNGIESLPAKLTALPKDSTAPAIATSLTALATDNGIELSWLLPVDNDLTDVIIQWATDSAPLDITTGNRLSKIPVTQLSLTHTSVEPGQSYYYRIFTADGFENVSPTPGPTAVATAISPNTITGLTNLQAYPGDGQVELRWQALPIGVQADLTIKLIRSTDPNIDLSDPLLTREFIYSDSTSYLDTDVVNGQTMNYWIYTEDPITQQTSPTIHLAAEPSDEFPPMQLQNVRATPEADRILLQWDENDLNDVSLIIIKSSNVDVPINSSQGTEVYRQTPGREPLVAVENLLPDTTYHFSFFTFDSQLNESLPVSINATTQDIEAPEQPVNFRAFERDQEILLYWDLPVGDELSQIRLVRNPNLITAPTDGDIIEVSPSQQAYTDSDISLINGQLYYYALYFIDTSGNMSQPAMLSATPRDESPPQKISTLQGVGTDNQVSLSWVHPFDNDIDHLVIRYQEGELPTQSPFGTTNIVTDIPAGTEAFDVTNLLNDTLYTFSVFTLDAAGNYEGFEIVSAQPKSTAPTPPAVDFAAIAGDSRVHLNWVNPPANYDGISIYRSIIGTDDAINNGTPVGTLPYAQGVTNITDIGLQNGVTHYYALINSGLNGLSIPVTVSAIPVDQTEPLPISNLVTTSSDNQIEFTWTDPNDADLDHILIRRGQNDFPLNEFDGVEVDQVPAGNMASIETGLTNDVIYFYAFFAVDINNYYSQRVTVAIAPSDKTAPSPVSNLLLANNDASVTLSWDNPLDIDLDRIVIRRDDATPPATFQSGVSVASLDSGGGSIPTSFTDINLINLEDYFYSVFAVDANNNASTVMSITGYPADTDPPASVSITSLSELDSQVDISWSNPLDPDFTEVIVVRRSDTYPTDPADASPTVQTLYQGTGTSLSDTQGLVNGSTYYYRLFSVDAYGNFSHLDLTAMPRDLTPPDAITGLTITPGDQSIMFDWTQPVAADLATIIIRRRSDDFPVDETDGVLVTGAEINGAIEIATDNDPLLTNGVSYFYAFFAKDSSGLISSRITTAASPVDTIAPAAVSNLTVTAEEGAIFLDWDNPLDADLARIVIRRSSVPPAPLTFDGGFSVASIDGGGGPVPSEFRDSNVVVGSPYYYSVFAVDGENNPSTLEDNAAPAVPFDATAPAVATFVSATGGENNQVTVSWTEPTEFDYTNMVICRKAGAVPLHDADCDNRSVVPKSGTATNSHIETLLSNATSYNFYLFSADATPNYSPGLLVSGMTDFAPIPAPTVNMSFAQDSSVFLYLNYQSTSGHFSRFTIVRNDDAYVALDPADGTVVHNSSSAYVYPSGLTNGNTYTFTLFAIEDDSEWVIGEDITLAATASGEIEMLFPYNLDTPNKGIPTALTTSSFDFFTISQGSPNTENIYLNRLDIEGNLASATVAQTATLAADQIRINDFSSNSGIGVGYYFDSVTGEKDLTIWSLSTSPYLYSHTRHDNVALEDEVANNVVYDNYGTVVSGHVTTAALPAPTIWRLSGTSLSPTFETAGAWSIASTFCVVCDTVDHIQMSDGTHFLALSDGGTSDQLVAVSLTNTNANLVNYFNGSGELALTGQVTALAQDRYGASNISYPIYVATTLGAAGADITSYNADGSVGALALNLSPYPGFDVTITSMLNENGTLHVLATADDGAGDNDLVYWRISGGGVIEVERIFDDGDIPGARNDLYSHKLSMHTMSDQLIFTAAGFDGIDYEIISGRIAND